MLKGLCIIRQLSLLLFDNSQHTKSVYVTTSMPQCVRCVGSIKLKVGLILGGGGESQGTRLCMKSCSKAM